jgi:hypothetical protein
MQRSTTLMPGQGKQDVPRRTSVKTRCLPGLFLTSSLLAAEVFLLIYTYLSLPLLSLILALSVLCASK